MGHGTETVRTRPRTSLPALYGGIAFVQALVVLGPALLPGLSIRYDMVWSPDPRLTPFVLGLDTAAPRVVPSDAVAVLLGSMIGAGAAQKVILIGILTGLGAGAALLLGELCPSAGGAARTAALVGAVWNPYVYERLMVGQWTVIAGLALLPWALRLVLRVLTGQGTVRSLAGIVVLAGLGGANTLLVVLSATGPALLAVAAFRRDRRSTRTLAATILVAVGMSAAWAVPAMIQGARSAPLGAAAFLPIADSPLGLIGSLLGGGGFWNTAVHPAARQGLVLSAAAALLWTLGIIMIHVSSRGHVRVVILAAVAAPTAVVAVSITPPLEPVWRLLVTDLPGGGLLRDSHKLLAAWVLVGALGLGRFVEWLRARAPAVAGPTAVMVLLAPVALAPFLAWGGLGQLSAVQVPAGLRAAMAEVNAAPPGEVGLLPWSQYRRYDWNDSRISLTLVPRMVDKVVLFDDSLPLRGGTVAGESARADAVTEAINQGESPVRVLARSGVRYIVLERTAAGRQLEPEFRAVGADLVVENSEVLVLDLGSSPDGTGESSSVVSLVGWIITVGTGVLVGVAWILRRVAALRWGRKPS